MESHFERNTYRRCVAEGLRILGVDNLFLQIHDPSFPGFEDEDTSHGSAYTRGGANFLKRVRYIGFDGLQLGPQGATSAINPSPYDGTVFSRNPLTLSLKALCEEGLLSEEQLGHWLQNRPRDRNRAHYRFAFQVLEQALPVAYQNFCRLRRDNDPLVQERSKKLAEFRQANDEWLQRDALYAALFKEQGGHSWRNWVDASGQPHSDRHLWNPRSGEEEAMARRRVELMKQHEPAMEQYAFVQQLVHEQHDGLRALCTELGLKLYADLQIGVADQDAWSYRSLFMDNYRMGAPPSRTNRQGQPWGFMVLDPYQYHDNDGRPGPVLQFVNARLRKVHAEYDGLRVDHPQGWVSPWVYRADDPDPFHAVQNGARLFSSPDLPDHPELGPLAIVRPDQLNRDLPRHADRWIREVSPEQVDRYATLFTYLLPKRAEGRHEVMCEVLSTMPFPLYQVMERYGLGRFRVLQHADPNDPYDVYRSDQAQPSDWIMLGNHDTPPIWKLAQQWCETGESRARAADLSRRLEPREAERQAWIDHFATHPGALVHALFADMLHSKARNIMVFFSDMLGMQERYNTPGTVSEDNWSLRVPPDFEEVYLKRVAEEKALNLPYAIALALKPRLAEIDADLVRGVEDEVERLRARGRAL